MPIYNWASNNGPYKKGVFLAPYDLEIDREATTADRQVMCSPLPIACLRIANLILFSGNPVFHQI